MLLGLGAKPRPLRAHTLARPRNELAHGRFVLAQSVGDLGIRAVERLAQNERRALLGPEPLQHHHQPERQVVRERIHISILAALPAFHGQHRLRQPRPDIDLARGLRAAHPVETKPHDDGRQPRRRLLDRAVIGRLPAQIGVLHRIFRLAPSAEHAVGDAGQPLAFGFEDGGRGHAAFAVGVARSCTTMRSQVCAKPIPRFTAG